jgi:predicted DNA-binding ArsR family transcriptional regulator
MEQLLHEIENNESSQQHLKDNGEKFSRHCNFVLALMYKGHRLTARQLEREYNIDGRRLRDIFANRKECKRQWRKDADGKTQEMEYWLDIPQPFSKTELGEKTAKVISMMKKVEDNLVTVFTLPDDKPNYEQGNLF